MAKRSIGFDAAYDAGTRPGRHMATLDIDRLNRRRKEQNLPVREEELTSEQVAECRDLFAMFDINRDNVLGKSEFGPMMRALGLQLTEKELQTFFERIDTDGDRSITFEELTGFLEKIARPISPQEELEEAFNIFADAVEDEEPMPDNDEDMEELGPQISAAGLARVLASMGEDVSEMDCADMIAAATGGDSVIALEEFTRMCETHEACERADRGGGGSRSDGRERLSGMYGVGGSPTAGRRRPRFEDGS